MKYYSRKIDNGWAKQIIQVTEDNKFYKIYFEEIGSGYHKGFEPNDFEIGKKVQRGFYAKYGFTRFYPSEEWKTCEIERDIEELEMAAKQT